MRLRNWLLTGTSLAVLSLAPAVVRAQDAGVNAAYQAYVEAQASGDAAAADSARQALAEACIVAGFASIDECVAALQGGAAPAAEEPAPAPEPEPEPAPAEEAAPAPAEPAPAPAAEQPAPEPEPAPPAAEQPAPEPEPAPAPAAEQPAPEPEPAPAPAEQAAPAEQPAAPAEEAAPAGPTPEEQQAQFVADLQAALDQYQGAINQASGGDYAGAKPVADAAQARILELCTANGYPDIKSCIGQDLPPLPEPTAEQPAAPAEQPAEQPAAAPAEQPAAPAEQPAAEAPAEQPAAVDPAAAAQARLGTAVELYNVGIGQLQAGDAAGQSTIDAANQQFAEICAALNMQDVAQCLQQNGITLPPVPEVTQPAAPAQPPLAELPGAQEAVTPEATEVLPQASAPETAAPVLDSAKDTAAAPAQGQAPAAEPAQPAQPEQPAAPPPADDKAAQAEIVPVEVQSLRELQGEAFAADALPDMEVPQNVTVINTVTNVTNVTNTTNNTTNITNNTTNTTNNNAGGDRDGKRPGRDRGNDRPNYTNSGFIFQVGVNLVISNPGQDFDRITDSDRDQVDYERLRNGRIKETVTRPNGVQIVTIRDRYGHVLKRSRITPDGREYILAYYDEDRERDDNFSNWRDPGDNLPPLRLNIPIRDYILDADYADEEEVELFFREPPVERVRQIYTIDDVKRSARIRDSVRRVEVGGLTFDSGAATISRTQVGALSKVANAMLKVLEDNPAETFLIEGHTDAVGSDQANLVLSDQRAATVARILSDFYDVPPENLVTQGYGERYLKVKTEAAERLNRRVSIKRITPLITVADRN